MDNGYVIHSDPDYQVDDSNLEEYQLAVPYQLGCIWLLSLSTRNFYLS